MRKKPINSDLLRIELSVYPQPNGGCGYAPEPFMQHPGQRKKNKGYYKDIIKKYDMPKQRLYCMGMGLTMGAYLAMSTVLSFGLQNILK